MNMGRISLFSNQLIDYGLFDIIYRFVRRRRRRKKNERNNIDMKNWELIHFWGEIDRHIHICIFRLNLLCDTTNTTSLWPIWLGKKIKMWYFFLHKSTHLPTINIIIWKERTEMRKETRKSPAKRNHNSIRKHLLRQQPIPETLHFYAIIVNKNCHS